MRIRARLLFGFGFYVLFALVLGIFSYGVLRTVTSRLAIVENADDLTNTMLEVRRYEKNFLLFKDEESSRSIKAYLGRLRAGIDRIQAETRSEASPKSFEAMKAVTAEYEGIFDELVGTLAQQEQARRRILELGDSIERGLAGSERAAFLDVREREKSFLADRSGTARDRLVAALDAGGPARDGRVRSYRDLVDGLFDLSRMESDSLERLRAKARDIQSLAESLSSRERAAIDSVLDHARESLRGLLLAIVVAVALGVVIDAQLSRSIATPIRALEELTHKIAAGDFSGRIGIRGEDEFSSLARSFNQMQDRLHDTLTTLELANESLRKNRAQLLEAEKFAALGRFSAGVAHEINNPLAIINEKAGLMKDFLAAAAEFPERRRLRELAEAIAETVGRCSAVTHRILNYAGTVAVSSEDIDVNGLVAEVVKSLEAQLHVKHVLLAFELHPGLPRVVSGRVQVRQVLADIVRNAVDSVARGGQIRVSTALLDADTLQVTVRDNGPGIPRERLEHIFEPFSTTRETGMDPGLGLWISHGIMKKLGGDLLVASAPGEGTAYTVRIPVCPPAAETAPA
jgi:signal transduction histidine kinase